MSKVIPNVVYDFMMKSSQRLYNAAVAGETSLAEAVLKDIKETIGFYELVLMNGDVNGTD
jgi:hypothetical protein